MKAVIVERGLPALIERSDPAPARDEALIRVILAGICGTDLEIARGYMHHRGVLGILGRDGAFAERVVLPISNLHAVPDAIPDEAAVFTEPLAAANEILEQIAVPAGSRTLVLGDGRLGQLCAQVLMNAGAPPLVVGKHRSKLRRLAELGLRTVANTETLPREFDIVIEATGSAEGLGRALEVVRPRGTVVLKSTYHGETSLTLAGLVIDEITLVGSRCGSFEPALAHLASDRTLHDGMVTARYPLADAPAAFAHAASPSALKVLLVP